MNKTPNIPYQVAPDAIPPLLEYIREHNIQRVFLVADSNTYRVLGQRAEAALRSAGVDVKLILLTDDEIHTNEHFAIQVLWEANGEDRPFISVGSGTVTDLTRFASHRSREFFISLPTAPSVDGFTSVVAPMVIGKYKYPVPAQPPAAVFADLPTLCAAPRPMIAAGLGDLLGKYTSLADWQIGALIYDEPYDPSIEESMRVSVDQTVEVISSIASAECDGITRLMDGLVGAGFGMLAFGDSRPASGSEHHLCHYWEYRRILNNQPAVLHGADVGVCTILSARRYANLRQLTREEAARRLEKRSLPSQQQLVSEITAGYGPVTDLIMKIQAPLLNMTESDLDALKARILTHWDAIQQIARSVPAPEQIEAWLAAVQGCTRPDQIGLDEAEYQLGLRSAHYLRDRFTLNRLGFWLDIPF